MRRKKNSMPEEFKKENIPTFDREIKKVEEAKG